MAVVGIIFVERNQKTLRAPRWVHCLLLLLRFRKNVYVTCKIVSFLCSLDNLKNAIVFVLKNQISKWRSFEKKRAIFNLLLHVWSPGKRPKIPSAYITLTYLHVFCSQYSLFCLPNFAKNANLSCMVSLWCDFWC